MNFFEAQEFFRNLHPGKEITFEFDEKCHRVHEVIYTDGLPNPFHHIENHKVKITVEGMDPMYLPIAPHRENVTWVNLKGFVNAKTDVFLHEHTLNTLISLEDNEDPNFEIAIQEVLTITGLTRQQVEAKMLAKKQAS